MSFCNTKQVKPNFLSHVILNDEALFHFNGSVDRDFLVVVLYYYGLSRRYLSTMIRQVRCGVPFTALKRFQDYTFFQDVTINRSGNALRGIGTISRQPTSWLPAAHMVSTRHSSAKFCHWYSAVELPTRKMDWP